MFDTLLRLNLKEGMEPLSEDEMRRMSPSELDSALEERYGIASGIATTSGPLNPETAGDVNAAAGRFSGPLDLDADLDYLDDLYRGLVDGLGQDAVDSATS